MFRNFFPKIVLLMR